MIRRTTLADLPRILEIYAFARAYMKANGNPNQWKDNRPSEATIRKDMENGNSYVIEEDGRIVGVFALILGRDSTYDVIEEGAWLSDTTYGVIHRIASDGSSKGILKMALDYAFSQVDHLRIDTHEDNRPMNHLLVKYGFTYCGIIYTDDGTKRKAYEHITGDGPTSTVVRSLAVEKGTSPVTVIKSNRKTIAIQVNPDLSVTVRAPKYASKRDIERILKEKEPWIQKHMEQIEKRKAELEASGMEKLTTADLLELAEKAKKVIPDRVQYYAKIMGVDYGRITIRNQKSRWGSCSSKGNLNFNCLLMLLPMEAVDYVVVHELCHRKEMNHSSAFWNEVAKVLPDYKDRQKLLKTKGALIWLDRL